MLKGKNVADFEETVFQITKEYEGWSATIYDDPLVVTPTVGYGLALIVKDSEGDWSTRDTAQLNRFFDGIHEFTADEIAELNDITALMDDGLNADARAAIEDADLTANLSLTREEGRTVLLRVVSEEAPVSIRQKTMGQFLSIFERTLRARES